MPLNLNELHSISPHEYKLKYNSVCFQLQNTHKFRLTSLQLLEICPIVKFSISVSIFLSGFYRSHNAKFSMKDEFSKQDQTIILSILIKTKNIRKKVPLMFQSMTLVNFYIAHLSYPVAVYTNPYAYKPAPVLFYIYCLTRFKSKCLNLFTRARLIHNHWPR